MNQTQLAQLRTDLNTANQALKNLRFPHTLANPYGAESAANHNLNLFIHNEAANIATSLDSNNILPADQTTALRGIIADDTSIANNNLLTLAERNDITDHTYIEDIINTNLNNTDVRSTRMLKTLLRLVGPFNTLPQQQQDALNLILNNQDENHRINADQALAFTTLVNRFKTDDAARERLAQERQKIKNHLDTMIQNFITYKEQQNTNPIFNADDTGVNRLIGNPRFNTQVKNAQTEALKRFEAYRNAAAAAIIDNSNRIEALEESLKTDLKRNEAIKIMRDLEQLSSEQTKLIEQTNRNFTNTINLLDPATRDQYIGYLIPTPTAITPVATKIQQQMRRIDDIALVINNNIGQLPFSTLLTTQPYDSYIKNIQKNPKGLQEYQQAERDIAQLQNVMTQLAANTAYPSPRTFTQQVAVQIGNAPGNPGTPMVARTLNLPTGATATLPNLINQYVTQITTAHQTQQNQLNELARVLILRLPQDVNAANAVWNNFNAQFRGTQNAQDQINTLVTAVEANPAVRDAFTAGNNIDAQIDAAIAAALPQNTNTTTLNRWLRDNDPNQIINPDRLDLLRDAVRNIIIVRRQENILISQLQIDMANALTANTPERRAMLPIIFPTDQNGNLIQPINLNPGQITTIQQLQNPANDATRALIAQHVLANRAAILARINNIETAPNYQFVTLANQLSPNLIQQQITRIQDHTYSTQANITKHLGGTQANNQNLMPRGVTLTEREKNSGKPKGLKETLKDQFTFTTGLGNKVSQQWKKGGLNALAGAGLTIFTPLTATADTALQGIKSVGTKVYDIIESKKNIRQYTAKQEMIGLITEYNKKGIDPFINPQGIAALQKKQKAADDATLEALQNLAYISRLEPLGTASLIERQVNDAITQANLLADTLRSTGHPQSATHLTAQAKKIEDENKKFQEEINQSLAGLPTSSAISKALRDKWEKSPLKGFVIAITSTALVSAIVSNISGGNELVKNILNFYDTRRLVSDNKSETSSNTDSEGNTTAITTNTDTEGRQVVTTNYQSKNYTNDTIKEIEQKISSTSAYTQTTSQYVDKSGNVYSKIVTDSDGSIEYTLNGKPVSSTYTVATKTSGVSQLKYTDQGTVSTATIGGKTYYQVSGKYYNSDFTTPKTLSGSKLSDLSYTKQSEVKTSTVTIDGTTYKQEVTTIGSDTQTAYYAGTNKVTAGTSKISDLTYSTPTTSTTSSFTDVNGVLYSKVTTGVTTAYYKTSITSANAVDVSTIPTSVPVSNLKWGTPTSSQTQLTIDNTTYYKQVTGTTTAYYPANADGSINTASIISKPTGYSVNKLTYSPESVVGTKTTTTGTAYDGTVYKKVVDTATSPSTTTYYKTAVLPANDVTSSASSNTLYTGTTTFPSTATEATYINSTTTNASITGPDGKTYIQTQTTPYSAGTAGATTTNYTNDGTAILPSKSISYTYSDTKTVLTTTANVNDINYTKVVINGGTPSYYQGSVTKGLDGTITGTVVDSNNIGGVSGLTFSTPSTTITSAITDPLTGTIYTKTDTGGTITYTSSTGTAVTATTPPYTFTNDASLKISSQTGKTISDGVSADINIIQFQKNDGTIHYYTGGKEISPSSSIVTETSSIANTTFTDPVTSDVYLSPEGYSKITTVIPGGSSSTILDSSGNTISSNTTVELPDVDTDISQGFASLIYFIKFCVLATSYIGIISTAASVVQQVSQRNDVMTEETAKKAGSLKSQLESLNKQMNDAEKTPHNQYRFPSPNLQNLANAEYDPKGEFKTDNKKKTIKRS